MYKFCTIADFYHVPQSDQSVVGKVRHDHMKANWSDQFRWAGLVGGQKLSEGTKK